jgi:hypothetical protein
VGALRAAGLTFDDRELERQSYTFSLDSPGHRLLLLNGGSVAESMRSWGWNLLFEHVDKSQIHYRYQANRPDIESR